MAALKVQCGRKVRWGGIQTHGRIQPQCDAVACALATQTTRGERECRYASARATARGGAKATGGTRVTAVCHRQCHHEWGLWVIGLKRELCYVARPVDEDRTIPLITTWDGSGAIGAA